MKVMMLNFVEKACQKSIIQQTPNVSRFFQVKNEAENDKSVI